MERNPGKDAIFFYGLLEFIMYPKERLRSEGKIISSLKNHFMEMKLKKSSGGSLNALEIYVVNNVYTNTYPIPTEPQKSF